MNTNIWEGKWKQLKGDIQSKWRNLNDDDMNQVEGDRTKLEGLIQEKYGLAVEETKKILNEIEKKYSN